MDKPKSSPTQNDTAPPTTSSSNNSTDPLEGSSVDKVVTTTFVEQRNLLTEDARVTGSDFSNEFAKTSAISELPMELLPMFEKPSLVTIVDWTSAQSRHSKIYEVDIPQILASLSGPQKIFLRLYALFRMSLEVRLQLNSNKFNVGRLNTFFMPGYASSDTVGELYTASGYPSVYLDASESSVRTIIIPFTAVQEYFTTNIIRDVDVLGRLVVMVVNPLVGTSNVHLSVYIRPVNPSLHLPIADHDPLVPTGFMEAINTGVSAIGSGFSGVEKLLTGDFSGGFGKFGEAFGLTGSAFSEIGLDQPTNPVSDYKCIARALPSHSRAVGPMDDESLSLIPALEGVNLGDAYFSTTGDEMDVAKIISTPMMIDIVTWNSSIPSNSVLFTCPVSPMVCNKFSEDTTTATYAPTYLAWLSNLYNYWTGGIRYHFSIISTPFHTGRLMVYFKPFESDDSSSSTSLVNASAYPNMVFDLQTGKEFDFIVPYNCYTGRRLTTPAASTVEGANNVFNANVTPFISSRTTIQQWAAENDVLSNVATLMTLGNIYVIVQNPLNAPPSVAANIEINVSISADTDFILSKPRSPLMDQFTTTDPTLSASALGYDTIDDPLIAHADISLASPRTGDDTVTAKAEVGNSTHRLGLANYEEKEMHLKIFMSRMFFHTSKYFKIDPDPNKYPIMFFPVCPNISYHTALVKTGSDFGNTLDYIGSIFRFWTGGMRYHFVGSNSNVYNELMIASHIPTAAVDSAARCNVTYVNNGENALSYLSNFHHQISSTCYQNSLNIVCPYRSVYDRLYCALRGLPETDGRLAAVNGTIAFMIVPSQTSASANVTRPGVTISTYLGPGDDFRFFYMIPPGQISIVKAVV